MRAAQILERLEIAQVLGELVVELRELAPLDRHHVHGEDRLLAGELRVAVVLRES